MQPCTEALLLLRAPCIACNAKNCGR